MRKAAIAAAFVAAFSSVVFAQDRPSADLSPAAPPAPSEAGAWSAAVEAARVRHDDWLACVEAKRFKCDGNAKADPMAALLDDDTLVEGDIVATPQGLRVFRGPPQTPHRREDFQ
jgi:hypothetical protein